MFFFVLLSMLSAPEWTAREKAMALLHPVRPEQVAALENLERKSPSAEARRRASWLLDRYYLTNADRLSREITDVPPISYLPPWLDEFVRDGAREEAFHSIDKWFVGHHEQPGGITTLLGVRVGWTEYARIWEVEATRVLLRGKISARVPYQPLLDHMRAEFKKKGEK